MSNIAQPKPGDAIRGPRRARATTVPPPPSVELVANAVRAAAPPPLPAAASRAPEPPAPPAPVTRPVDTTMARRPSRARRVASFAGGVLLGAIVLSAMRGDFHDTRAWAAKAIRSLKHGATTRVAPPADVDADVVPLLDTPCSAEDCALLMAPFENDPAPTPVKRGIATVRAEDLPRVRPPVVWSPPPPAPAASAAASSTPAPAASATERPIEPAAATSAPAPTTTTSAAPASSAAPAPSAAPSAPPTPSNSAPAPDKSAAPVASSLPENDQVVAKVGP